MSVFLYGVAPLLLLMFLIGGIADFINRNNNKW